MRSALTCQSTSSCSYGQVVTCPSSIPRLPHRSILLIASPGNPSLQTEDCMANTNNGRTALITGASRGLGLALSRSLAHRGWNLILTAQQPARLRAVRDELAAITHVAAIAGDVTDSQHQ